MVGDNDERGLVSAEPPSSLWAITSYFNPVGYTSRLRNYRTFRRRLVVPLVTVELARDRSRFQLEASDADVLLQVTGEDFLWQKERLLNVALAALPSQCNEVAWLDCDVVFAEDEWAERAHQALARVPLLQPFSRIHELAAEATPEEPDLARSPRSGHSVARLLAEVSSAQDLLGTNGKHPTLGTFKVGMAWAARRALLEEHGIYDACVVGSGDHAFAVAALGCFESLRKLHMNERQTEHYLAWARPFFEAVRGRVGYVDSTLLHLWHGDRPSRRYGQRLRDFVRFGFDPYADIAVDAQGCWRWATEKNEMRAYLRDYFEARREDGGESTMSDEK
jgi:hypothetical protein